MDDWPKLLTRAGSPKLLLGLSQGPIYHQVKFLRQLKYLEYSIPQMFCSLSLASLNCDGSSFFPWSYATSKNVKLWTSTVTQKKNKRLFAVYGFPCSLGLPTKHCLSVPIRLETAMAPAYIWTTSHLKTIFDSSTSKQNQYLEAIPLHTKTSPLIMLTLKLGLQVTVRTR